jgi:ferredoxin
MAFLDEARSLGRVITYPRDEGCALDVARIVADSATHTRIYCCGPERLMRAAEQAAGEHPGRSLHVERFVPRPNDPDTGLQAFEVEFANSKLIGRVESGQSILDVARDLGIEVSASCREGTCGSCETPVLSGAVCHRDSILTDEERAASRTMMICISRATSARIVLDL